MAAGSGGETVGTIARAVQLLRVIAEAPGPCSLTEVSERLQLPSSTVHRLLALLRGQGMVEFDPATRRYSPGLEFVRLGRLVADGSSLAEIARPFLRAVVDATGETAQLGVLLPEQDQMMFVEQVLCEHALRFAIPMERPQPLVWGCSGRVILAHLDEAAIERVLAAAEASPVTGASPPSAARMRKRLAQIRERGWDTTTGEKLASAVGFAAPVFGPRGVVGSVSTPVPSVRYDPRDEERYAAAVVDAARRLSRALGGAEPAVAGELPAAS